MDYILLAMFMYFVSVLIIVLGFIYMELFIKAREDRIKEDLKKKFPHLREFI